MDALIRNVGPLLCVLGALSWLCWDHLTARVDIVDASDSAIAQLDPTRLNPVLPSLSSRNPLRTAAARPGTTPAPSTAVSRMATGNQTSARTAGPASPTAPDTSHGAKGLKLSGTLVGGSQRSALINGRVYFEGEAVFPGGNGSASPVTVSRIEWNHVVLANGNRKIRLGYDGIAVCDPAPEALPSGGILQNLGSLLTWMGMGEAEGVGSRFRPTMNHMETGLSENDSRPPVPFNKREWQQ